MKIEPSSDMRQMANFLFMTYTAFLDAGFDPDKAFYLMERITVDATHPREDDDE